jgi:outer membrane protein TolC
MRTLHLRKPVAVLALLLVARLGGAHAQSVPDPNLPPEANVTAALLRSPAYQAALRSVDAESAVRQQMRVGPHEWTGSVNAARREQRTPAREDTSEWELGLDRTLRWPGKSAAYQQVGDSRLAQARSALARSWREQARALLGRHGQWLREHEAARIWAEQAALLQRQSDAVAQRRKLGDAARIDEQLAESALLQARAQAQAAERRSQAARELLQAEFPDLILPARAAVAAPPALAEAGVDWLAAQRASSPELELAVRESATAQAQLGADRSEARPDPTVGVRVGQARSGAERFVGVVLSLPFGGEYRTAGAAAAAARAAAAEQHLADAERRVRAEATLRLRDAQAAQALWSDLDITAQKLTQVANGLQRSYQLGEGTLSDVIAARRLAIDQQLAAAIGAADAWTAHHRLALEAGLLWREPALVP